MFCEVRYRYIGYHRTPTLGVSDRDMLDITTCIYSKIDGKQRGIYSQNMYNFDWMKEVNK